MKWSFGVKDSILKITKLRKAPTSASRPWPLDGWAVRCGWRRAAQNKTVLIRKCLTYIVILCGLEGFGVPTLAKFSVGFGFFGIFILFVTHRHSLGDSGDDDADPPPTPPPNFVLHVLWLGIFFRGEWSPVRVMLILK